MLAYRNPLMGAQMRAWIVLFLIVFAVPANGQEASSMTGDEAYARAVAYFQAKFANQRVEADEIEARLRAALVEIKRLKKLADKNDTSAEKALNAFAQGNGKKGIDSLFVEADAKAKSAATLPLDAAENYKHIGTLAFAIDPRQAIVAYQAALNLSPNDFDTLQKLWLLNRQLGYIDVSDDIAERLAAETDPTTQAQGLVDKGADAESRGDLATAKSNFTAALDLARAVGSKHIEGWALAHLGEIAAERSEFGVAVHYAKQALSFAKKLGDRQLATDGWGVLGSSSLDINDLAAANKYYSLTVSIAVQANLRLEEAHGLVNLAAVASHRGDDSLAEKYSQKSLKLTQEIDDPAGRPERLRVLASYMLIVVISLVPVFIMVKLSRFTNKLALPNNGRD